MPAGRAGAPASHEMGGMKLPHRNTLIVQAGKIGYILLWLLGVPIPILFFIYLLRGCT
jgi:hypothetical protein